MKRVGEFFQNIVRNKMMLLMVLPGALWFLFFSYLPMFGTVIAFKEYRFDRDGFWASIVNSKWVGVITSYSIHYTKLYEVDGQDFVENVFTADYRELYPTRDADRWNR